MLRSKTRPNTAHVEIDPETPSIADQFAEIMGHIRVEYDLEPDVWDAARGVFQALKAREEGWSQQFVTPGRVYM